MTDWSDVREEGDFLISGSVSREELEAETKQLDSRSLFDTRLKNVLLKLLDDEDGKEDIHVEAIVRKADLEE